MAKEWEVIEKNEWNYLSVERYSDRKIWKVGELTFHGPIKRFWVTEDRKMMACFEEGDALCDIDINDIKEPLQDPCDESHTDVWARTQAIAFAKWTCERLWSTHDEMWYPYQDEDNPITGDALYDLYIKETENK